MSEAQDVGIGLLARLAVYSYLYNVLFTFVQVVDVAIIIIPVYYVLVVLVPDFIMLGLGDLLSISFGLAMLITVIRTAIGD